VIEAAGALARDPREGIERARERIARRRERRPPRQRYERSGGGRTACTAACLARGLVGLGGSPTRRGRDVVSSLTTSALAVGRGSYRGWDDAGPGLARAAWRRPSLEHRRPPLRQGDLPEETGAAVPERCRARWAYIKGSSGRCLPGLLAELDEIDPFVHDGVHTARNLRFELDHASASLRRARTANSSRVPTRPSSGWFPPVPSRSRRS
jgi:hypothetical protein